VKVAALVNGRFAENTYLVIDEPTRQCAIIDPGEDAGLIQRAVEDEAATPGAVWLTHAHVDHVAGVAAVIEAFPVPIYLHPADRPLYDHLVQQAAGFGFLARAAPPPDRELAEGDELRLGGLTLRVLHTPGHTPGGVSLYGHGAVFVGDALFQGSIGRTDFPGGDAPTLLRSIREKLLSLPDETVVYSGHGPATTIGRERRTNPFLTGAARLL
jgi:hydroxyacylglutathione hydrolase